MIVAYQGAPGAFGHEACLAFAPEDEPRPFATFAAAAAAVAAGEADFGLLPVRNSEAGEVPDVRRIIAEAGLTIASEHRLPVRMHLLGLPDAQLAGLTAVVSHPVALRQCAVHLAALGLAAEEAANTALAAQALRDPRKAVLASQAAAGFYGLKILLEDMQDDPGNTTVFARIVRG